MSCTAPSTCTRTRPGSGAQTANSTGSGTGRLQAFSRVGIASIMPATPEPNRRAPGLVAGSVPDQEGDGEPVEEVAQPDAARVGHRAGAGQLVAPRSDGQLD